MRTCSIIEWHDIANVAQEICNFCINTKCVFWIVFKDPKVTVVEHSCKLRSRDTANVKALGPIRMMNEWYTHLRLRTFRARYSMVHTLMYARLHVPNMPLTPTTKWNSQASVCDVVLEGSPLGSVSKSKSDPHPRKPTRMCEINSYA